MELIKNEQEMLEGKQGKGASIAMKVQVAIGESFGARRMVEITRAHVALSNQEADLWFAEKLLYAGARCKVPPTVNPGFCLEYFRKVSTVPEYDAAIMERTRQTYKELGAVLSFNCTPYLGSNIPHFGEVISFSESSATPFVNSVWGARTNRESAQSALCAAITGVVPEYGLLLDENRRGDILVEVEAEIKNDFDYQMLGYMGKKIGVGIPVFVGLPTKTITPEALMNLGAQLNTSGAYGMYHIVGFTPEARTLDEALGGRQPKKKVVITGQDLKNIQREISREPGKIEFAMFGCPHFSLRQIQQVAGMVEGKKLKMELWILTSSFAREMAERMGLLQIIYDSGGHIVADTCMDQPCWHHLRGKLGITDSPKLAYYTPRREMYFVIRDLKTCIETAMQGELTE